MPDIYEAYFSIYQHHMMLYCGVSVERFAHDFMLTTQQSGIGAGQCFITFVDWISKQHA